MQALSALGSRRRARERDKVEALDRTLASGLDPVPGDYLPARFTLDGREERGGGYPDFPGGDWPNFQTDCYGTWLWVLSEYLGRTGEKEIPARFREGVGLTLRYLRLVWKTPCYDPWEEHYPHLHPSSLACIYGGLEGIAPYLEGMEESEATPALAGEVQSFLLSNLTRDGRFPKYLGSESTDASLLWLAVPYGAVPTDHRAMRATVASIERELLDGGGVKRYPEDPYYGGRWPVLSCWLGWYHAENGEPAKAEPLLRWVEAQADESGHLPEQNAERPSHPERVAEWERRWGPNTAAPLLWAHAMYLVLRTTLERVPGTPDTSRA